MFLLSSSKLSNLSVKIGTGAFGGRFFQKSGEISKEEEKKVGQGHHRPNSLGHGSHDDGVRKEKPVQICEVFHFNRNDQKQQNLKIRKQMSKGQEQGQIQVRGRSNASCQQR